MIDIKIADVSLCESEQVYAARLSFKEKLETAKLLEKLRVDVIETGSVGESPADAAFIRTLASSLEHSVISVPVSLDRAGVDRVWSALSRAKKPRINIVVPTSTVQMEYRNQTKAEAVLPLVSEITAYCARLCPDIEFTAVDSARSEQEFLAAVLKAAIYAGAKTVTLCDSAGELLPDELYRFIASVYASVPELRSVTLSIHCKDSLGLASAAALTGISSGARQIKVSSVGKSGTLSLEQFLNVIKIRGETLGISSGINATALQRTCSQLAALAGGGVTERAAAGISGGKIDDDALPQDADIDALRNHVISLGYDVSEDDMHRIYMQFTEIARNKKVVSRDIEALIAETAGQASATYQLRNYVINSGSSITATALVEISKDGVVRRALSAGAGPIDAAFKAAEKILGGNNELEEFQIQAVTGGREATGDALVKLRNNGKLYSGRGVSTDIIGAGIRAYISAVNKIVFEERG
ncbi:MAG: hypothetical protein LBH28_09225 [Oscillospiraceae bacterium]|jgi:2-isopropylmalate synthase|nr:hypothetical protein [Oscillospiraceae bacterium]